VLLLPPEELEPEPLPLPAPLLLLPEPLPEPLVPPLLLLDGLELLPPLLDGLVCCDGTGLLLFVVFVVVLPLSHGVHTNSARTMTAAAMKPRIAIIMPALMPAAAAASPSPCPWS
jgi:hypothetical protein